MAIVARSGPRARTWTAGSSVIRGTLAGSTREGISREPGRLRPAELLGAGSRSALVGGPQRLPGGALSGGRRPPGIRAQRDHWRLVAEGAGPPVAGAAPSLPLLPDSARPGHAARAGHLRAQPLQRAHALCGRTTAAAGRGVGGRAQRWTADHRPASAALWARRRAPRPPALFATPRTQARGLRLGSPPSAMGQGMASGVRAVPSCPAPDATAGSYARVCAHPATACALPPRSRGPSAGAGACPGLLVGRRR